MVGSKKLPPIRTILIVSAAASATIVMLLQVQNSIGVLDKPRRFRQHRSSRDTGHLQNAYYAVELLMMTAAALNSLVNGFTFCTAQFQHLFLQQV
jgi:hypothetical protein